jgi:hypothetical protein
MAAALAAGDEATTGVAAHVCESCLRQLTRQFQQLRTLSRLQQTLHMHHHLHHTGGQAAVG